MFRGRDLDVIVEEKPDIKVEVKENFEDEVQVIQVIIFSFFMFRSTIF